MIIRKVKSRKPRSLSGWSSDMKNNLFHTIVCNFIFLYYFPQFTIFLSVCLWSKRPPAMFMFFPNIIWAPAPLKGSWPQKGTKKTGAVRKDPGPEKRATGSKKDPLGPVGPGLMGWIRGHINVACGHVTVWLD